MHQAAIFLVNYSELHHGDIVVHLNKNADLQFGLVQHIYDAQDLLNSVCILFGRHNVVLSQCQYKLKSPTNSGTLTGNCDNIIQI
jgi:hypothetical protein